MSEPEEPVSGRSLPTRIAERLLATIEGHEADGESALEKLRADSSELTDEIDRCLRAYESDQPMLARPPNTRHTLKKLVRRYRVHVLAGSLVFAALVTSGIGTFVQYLRAEQSSEESAELAKEKGRLAESEQMAREEAQAHAARFQKTVREFNQLAGMVFYERAIENEKVLFPPWPHMVEAMEEWLRGDCERLLTMRSDIERTVLDLRGRALLQDDEEKQRDLESHASFAEWQRLEQQVVSLRRAKAIHGGCQSLVVPELPPAQEALDASSLSSLAWDRVAPKPDQRKVYGEEALGLAFARAAVAKVEMGDDTVKPCRIYTLLACALFSNGLNDQAIQAARQATDASEGDHKEVHRAELVRLEQRITDAAEILAAAEASYASLTSDVTARQTWTFAEAESEFLHRTLTKLLADLDSMAANEKAAVDQHVSWARQIGDLSKNHPNARVMWADARAGLRSSEKYHGQTIELRDQDVIGLVPIGMNPVTLLWEFYHLRSAWDGYSDPKDLAIPEHGPDGSIAVDGETGIVFVLLPGGTFTMGAQARRSVLPNFDEQARTDEVPHRVSLAPFFLARHEMTQGQWRRLSLGHEPSFHKALENPVGAQQITWANPVEHVDWGTCGTLLKRYGLVLPTEAQWEYGCRARTTSPWLSSLSELRKYANVADATAKRAKPAWTCEPWTDGHVLHSPVGSFEANEFGLYDMHGNVWEWCHDEYGSYSVPVRVGDGLRLHSDGSSRRVLRGGSFYNPAMFARSAFRSHDVPTMRAGILGLRAARALRVSR